jgi:hypothetical protein
MAKLSRNQRHKARQRRTLSLLKREFRKLYQQHQNTMIVLLATLESAGGSLILGEATVKKTLSKYGNLTWKTEKQENGSVVVTLVDATPAIEPADSVSIHVVEDETREQQGEEPPVPDDVINLREDDGA